MVSVASAGESIQHESQRKKSLRAEISQQSESVKEPAKPAPVADTSATSMHVRKRDGSLELVNINKIIRRVARCSVKLSHVDPMVVAVKTIGGLYDGASTVELDNLAIQNSAMLMFEEPQYSKLASRLLNVFISEEVAVQGIYSFSQSILSGHRLGLISDEVVKFVSENSRELNEAIDDSRSDLFEYFGLRTIYERYLLRNRTTRKVIETPQYFFMRICCGLSKTADEAIEFYELISSFDYMPSTPTLFNAGTTHPQMSSCFLLDSPEDDLDSIYRRYSEIASLSKFSGGIGVAYHRVRSRGSLIKGTNGFSNGVVPWLKTLDSSVSAVNQGGKRKGACCVYLETWHADIDEFLELRDSTGDEGRRAHHINLANWIPDLFMKRVEEDAVWSLFDPKIVPHFTDLYGTEFEKAYIEAESKNLYSKQVKARDLYSRMMKTLAETGNGWMNFKDSCNIKSNQTGNGSVIHSSNLCTEIVEVTSDAEIAVCNLGSINLANHLSREGFDFEKLAHTVKVAVKYLDRVIDLNFYPASKAADSNNIWRPVGLGLMGMQDLFFKLHLPFDSHESIKLSKKIQEEIYYNALLASSQLAEELGMHESFRETKAAQGILQFDLWNMNQENERWNELRQRIMTHGLRNSLLIAIAPTATIASITGIYESIEPQISNMFKRETMSGEFMQINKYLVDELRELGLWNDAMRNQIKIANGSVQGISEIPEDIKRIFRTVWEIPMRGLIDMAAERAPFIDQSQSLNLFAESPNISRLSSMYMHAWKKGLKTTYYLRSRPATNIAKATTTTTELKDQVKISRQPPAPLSAFVSSPASAPVKKAICENPEACEVCQ